MSLSNEQRKAYEDAEPKQFGDLHERMKYLVKKIADIYATEGHAFDQRYPELRIAVFDLETEVKHYKPARPPYGSR